MAGDIIIGTLAAMGVALIILVPLAARLHALAPSLVCFAIHLAIGLYIVVSFGPSFDAATYHIAGLDYMRWLTGEAPLPKFAEGKEGFPLILGLLYATFGPYAEAGIVFNALAISLACALIAAATRAIGWPQAAGTASWIFVILPSILYWPSLLGREALALLLLSLMALGAGLVWSAKTVLGALFIWSGFVAGLWIRPQVFSVVAIALGIAFLAGVVVKRAHPASLIWVALPAALAGGLGISRGQSLELQDVGQQREFLMAASTRTDVSTEGFNSSIGALLAIARDVPAAALGPFPWNWSIGYWQLILDAVSWILMLGLVAYALARMSQPFPAAILVIPAVAAIFASAAIMGNWGILVRMRIHAIPFLAILAALGFLELRRRTKTSRDEACPAAGIHQGSTLNGRNRGPSAGQKRTSTARRAV